MPSTNAARKLQQETKNKVGSLPIHSLVPAGGKIFRLMLKTQEPSLLVSISNAEINIKRDSHLQILVFGSVSFVLPKMSGFAGKFIEYPFDTIKVHLQTQRAGASPFGLRGTAICIRSIYRKQGWRGFFRVKF